MTKIEHGQNKEAEHGGCEQKTAPPFLAPFGEHMNGRQRRNRTPDGADQKQRQHKAAPPISVLFASRMLVHRRFRFASEEALHAREKGAENASHSVQSVIMPASHFLCILSVLHG